MEQYRSIIDAMQNALVGVENTTPSSDFDLNKDQPTFDPAKLRNAAVLIPIIPGPNGLEVIFTKRSTTMRNHP
ncbi:MAG: CoA pyrophosphatase, partial [Amylibacter sp.]